MNSTINIDINNFPLYILTYLCPLFSFHRSPVLLASYVRLELLLALKVPIAKLTVEDPFQVLVEVALLVYVAQRRLGRLRAVQDLLHDLEGGVVALRGPQLGLGGVYAVDRWAVTGGIEETGFHPLDLIENGGKICLIRLFHIFEYACVRVCF